MPKAVSDSQFTSLENLTPQSLNLNQRDMIINQLMATYSPLMFSEALAPAPTPTPVTPATPIEKAPAPIKPMMGG